jgi:hypothetical protein
MREKRDERKTRGLPQFRLQRIHTKLSGRWSGLGHVRVVREVTGGRWAAQMEARWRGRTEPVERKEREPDLGRGRRIWAGCVVDGSPAHGGDGEAAHGGERHGGARARRETGEGGKHEKIWGE